MDFPLVSVGVPTFNRPVGLKKCLQHLLAQTYPNLEIIISDNCSTDPAVEIICREYASKDRRVQYHRQEQNIGLENNFNFVYERSAGTYFIWMSDDDHFDANYIGACVNFLEGNKDHVLCSGSAKYYDGEQYLFTEKMFAVDQKTPFRRILRYFAKVHKNANFYGVFRNGLLTTKPIGNHVGCDWSFMARLAVFGKLNYLASTYYHRSATGNSGNRRSMVKKFKLNRFKNIFFETYLATVVSGNIFKDPAVNRRMPWWKRKLLVLIVFFQVNWKLFTKFIRKVFKNEK